MINNNNIEINVNSLGFDEARELMRRLKVRLNHFSEGRGRATEHKYEDWDWTKKNSELSAEHGVCLPWVGEKRKELGMPKVCGGKHWPACKDWDWSKSNTEISRETGVQITTIARWRKTLKKPPVPRAYMVIYKDIITRQKMDLTLADWDKADVEIAKAIGCTREYIRQKRAELGKPKRRWTDLKYERFMAAMDGIKEISYEEARKKLPGLIHHSFRRWCGRGGITIDWKRTHAPYVRPWDQMNWKLPNKLLAEIWGDGMIPARFAAWRCGHPSLDRPAFVCGGTGRIPEEFKAIVDQEREKAAAWKAANQPF